MVNLDLINNVDTKMAKAIARELERSEKREQVLCLENAKKLTGVSYTHHDMGGKLAGLDSVNTNCGRCSTCVDKFKKGQAQKKARKSLISKVKYREKQIKLESEKENPDIKKMQRHAREAFEYLQELNQMGELVCGSCFAVRTMAYKKQLGEALNNNTDILTTRILEDHEIPIINRLYFRIESFGDLINITQAINYLKIALKNPNVTFAWWSKRPQIIEKALQALGIEAPKNIIFIFSSYQLNKPAPASIAERYPWIKIIFTVFDKWYLMEHPEVEIHCGDRKCLGCLKCYTKKEGLTYINELVK